MKYKWANKTRVPLDAQVVGEELERIKTKHDGRLTREIVLNEAKKQTSILHDAFEWDDTEAALQYRLEQARYIIKSVVVVFEDPDSEEMLQTRAFVSVTPEGEDKARFVSIQTALEHPDLRRQVFEKALKDINTWKMKYHYLTIFAKVFEDIDEINKLYSKTQIKKVSAKMRKWIGR